MPSVPGGKTGGAVLALVLVVAAVAVVGVAGAFSGSQTPSGRAILNDTHHQYETANSVVGIANVSVRGPQGSESATVRYAVKGNASRVIVRTNGTTYRAGTNGTVAWYTDGNTTRVRAQSTLRANARNRSSTRVSPDAMLNRTHALAKNATVTNDGRTSIDGRSAYVVRITPPNSTAQQARVTAWVATDTSKLLRINATDGTNTMVVSFPTTQFNVSVDASTFQPPTHRTAVTATSTYGTFTAAQANTTVTLPRLNGSFESARVATRPSGVSVLQRYTVDGRNVTVVSTTTDRFSAPANGTTVRVNGHDATAVTARGRSVVFWRANGTTTGVITGGTIQDTVAAANRTQTPRST